MVSHLETGSDSPIGPDRESGHDKDLEVMQEQLAQTVGAL